MISAGVLALSHPCLCYILIFSFASGEPLEPASIFYSEGGLKCFLFSSFPPSLLYISLFLPFRAKSFLQLLCAAFEPHRLECTAALLSRLSFAIITRSETISVLRLNTHLASTMHSPSLLATFLSLAFTLPVATSTLSTITAPPRPLLPRQTSSSTAFDANVAACASYSSIFGSCVAATSSFQQLPFSSEATCLCYTASNTYAPSIFDGYWGSCLNYYQTASPQYYSQTLSGDSLTRTPCAAAGNVLGTSAATGVASVAVTSSSSAAGGATATASSSGSGSKSHAASVERGGALLGLIGVAAVFALS
jgi:hypothetical protein